MKRDYKISIIRILAMFSIVACHFFQAKDMDIALWLNVGVQVFLFMSGFLYGKKKIKDTWLWIKKQFKKILVPYYIYIFCIIIIYVIFARNSLNIKNVMSLILCLQLINYFPVGLNHFWFIPVILICYLITPVLQKILKSKEKIGKKESILLLIIIFYIEYMFYQTAIDIRISNIVCYVIGYVISFLSVNYKKEKRIISICVIFLAVISNLMKIFFIPEEQNMLIRYIINMMIKNSHILLGSAIFIILYKILNNIEKNLKPTAEKIINKVDQYCYYIYITHHVFILGPLAIINLTQCSILNIIIIICCTIMSSYLLEKVTCFIKKGLKEA